MKLEISVLAFGFASSSLSFEALSITTLFVRDSVTFSMAAAASRARFFFCFPVKNHFNLLEVGAN